jgi:hypothetical protein
MIFEPAHHPRRIVETCRQASHPMSFLRVDHELGRRRPALAKTVVKLNGFLRRGAPIQPSADVERRRSYATSVTTCWGEHDGSTVLKPARSGWLSGIGIEGRDDRAGL